MKKEISSNIRWLLANIILIIVIITAVACGSTVSTERDETNKSSTKYEYETQNDKFIFHHIDDYYTILEDKETGVCYLEYNSKLTDKYGITTMVNEDGTPKIWEE